ncbi:MAG: hypothetical protein K1X64_04585 [Myxococcaceae bacterium]|nr:hypothetical protein [Myxococcaceae bacterium]
MKTWAGILTMAVMLCASACGGDLCSKGKFCANDPQDTQATIDQCRANVSAKQSLPCYAETLGVTNCILDNRVCGADGKADDTLSTNKAKTNCSTAATNWQNCCAKNPTSTLCVDGG